MSRGKEQPRFHEIPFESAKRTVFALDDITRVGAQQVIDKRAAAGNIVVRPGTFFVLSAGDFSCRGFRRPHSLLGPRRDGRKNEDSGYKNAFRASHNE